MNMQKIQLRAYSEKAADGHLRIIATDETFDRSGESIPFESWDLTNFEKSPRLLIDHDYRVQAIVGKAATISKDSKLRAIVFEPLFHEITQAAKETREMVEQGFLDTVSVGFMRACNPEGKEVNELMEISFVAVPANPNARMLSVKAVEPADEKAIEDFLEPEKKAWDETDDSIRHRVREPELFDDSTFRTVPIKEDKPRVNAVMGKLKGEDTMTVQSVIFPKEDGWTMEEAQKWMQEHPDVSKAPEPSDNAPKEGDACTMEDGTEGTMQVGENGELMCMMKKAPAPAEPAPAEEPDDDAEELQMCLAATDKCLKAVGAALALGNSEEDIAKGAVIDDAFAEMRKEITACLSDMGGGEGGQEGRAATKAGRVLSEKNRSIIKTAKETMQSGIVALDELLAATEQTESTEGKSKDKPEKKGRKAGASQDDDSFEKFVDLRKTIRAVNTALNDALRNARLSG